MSFRVKESLAVFCEALDGELSMVDREARDRILHFAEHGVLSDSDLSDIMSIKSKDRAVEVFHYLHHLRDDMDLERWKLFLRSNYEYQWEQQTKLPLWSLLLLPVIIPVLVVFMCLCFVAAEQMQILFARFGFNVNIGTPLFIIVVVVVVPTFILLDWLHGKATQRDHRVFPFYSRDEYEAAIGEDSRNAG
ncbi:MAG: hypothetical protein ABFD64_07415 [Armatimonadota bacterium]